MFHVNLFDSATYAVSQGNLQRRGFPNVQVADLFRGLHDGLLVHRRVLLEVRHGLEEFVVLTSIPADRSFLGEDEATRYTVRVREVTRRF